MQNENKSKTPIHCNDQTVRTTLKGMSTSEHEKVYSRTLRRDLEIGNGVHGRGKDSYGGLVPSNPFASQAQAGYMHSHPEVLGEKGLAEWDSATKGKKLPKRVKKSGK